MMTAIAAEPRIYLTETDLSPDLLERLFATLPPLRAAAASRFLRRDAKLQSVLGFALVRYAIYATTGCILNEDWQIDDKGKPRLEGAPFFSLSHTKHAVAVAISADRALGIDLEALGAHDLRLAERIATPEELTRINAAPNKETALLSLWCAKEAEGKRLGTGLETPKAIDTTHTVTGQIEVAGIPHILALSPAASLPDPIWITPEALLL